MAGISYDENELYIDDLDKKILYIKAYENNVIIDIVKIF